MTKDYTKYIEEDLGENLNKRKSYRNNNKS